MPIFETYSKRRKKRDQQGKADFYQYDALPEPFRHQVLYILGASLGTYIVSSPTLGPPIELPPSNSVWMRICETYSREHPLDRIQFRGDLREAWLERFLKADTDRALDMIEIAFRAMIEIVDRWSRLSQKESNIWQTTPSAIEELNFRFREHGIGYQFENGEIVRVDSQFIHAETVKPALSLLNEAGFEGAVDEFMEAHSHYRKGEYKQTLAFALSALESTLKAICDARGWSYEEKATAKPLIETVFRNGLLPGSLQREIQTLRSLLESGLPEVANPERHGQGTLPKDVPAHVAAYGLHLCASNIVFLVESYKASS